MKSFSVTFRRFALLGIILIITVCNKKSTEPDQFPPITWIDRDATWSASTGVIAYVHVRHFDSDDPDSSGIYTINYDGSGKRVLYEGHYIMGIDWSPDGRFLIANSNMILVRISFPSGQADTLTEAGEYWNPVWSPDGRYIAYSNRTGVWMGIYTLNLENGHTRRVINYCDFPNWLTSDSILYENRDRNFPDKSICISDTLGYFGRVVMPPKSDITTFYALRLNVPTKRIAFSGTLPGEPESIWAVDPGRTWARPVRGFASLSCFSPDGEKIVFTDIREGYGRLYTYKWNGGEIRQLTF